MNLVRRKLIGRILIICTSIPIASKSKNLLSLRNKDFPIKTVDDINVTSNFKVFYLPKEPKLGQVIYFHISKRSLRFPSRVKYETHKIAGDEEDLKLDTFGNFSLTFISKHEGWQLG